MIVLARWSQKLILRVILVNVPEKLFVLNAVTRDKFDGGVDRLLHGVLYLHLIQYEFNINARSFQASYLNGKIICEC